jgi:hypothetical protein
MTAASDGISFCLNIEAASMKLFFKKDTSTGSPRGKLASFWCDIGIFLIRVCKYVKKRNLGHICNRKEGSPEYLLAKSDIAFSKVVCPGASPRVPSKTVPLPFRILLTVKGLSTPKSSPYGGLPQLRSDEPEDPRPPRTISLGVELPETV